MTDIEIANSVELLPIIDIAKKVGIKEEELELYGKYKAKINLDIFNRLESKSNGKLILVTATNPTPLGEGKSTVSIGLTQGFNKLGYDSIVALREPSMGPVFGMKGGATGGGYSQVLPMEDINLHFTGDMHAITSAVNLIAACIDNHIYQGNELKIDKDNVFFKRAIDTNDRTLREVEIALGSKINGIPRRAKFQITVASEIMAILCLSNSLMELKERISNIIIGLNTDKEFVRVKDLKIEGAITVILKDAIKPNLVQTTENTPAIIHGGPFANIAHGCNSVMATKLALKLSNYVITEAGFGADLGAEKFFDIKCRQSGITPNLTVLVTTIRALKYHGENNLFEGLKNLKRHIENLKKYNIPIVVAINKFIEDTNEELEIVKSFVKEQNVIAEIVEIWEKGGIGAEKIVKTIVEILEYEENKRLDEDSDIENFDYLYNLELPLKEKIEKICFEIYRAKNVNFSELAIEKLKLYEEKGYKNLPICMSKTPMSFSDNPKLLGAPTDFDFNINDVSISAGAGFVVVFSGNVIDMPGLPKIPAAVNIDIDKNGKITGLF